MTPDQITQLRQALETALRLISGERIKYDTFPALEELEKTLEAYIRASEEELENALALLPCPTCNGDGIIVYTKEGVNGDLHKLCDCQKK